MRSIEKSWVSDIETLKITATAAKLKCQEINCTPWSILRMIDLFEDQIKLLQATSKTLDILKGSRLYKIENGEESMDDKIQDSTSSQNQIGGITAHTINIGNVGNIGQTNNKSSAKLGLLGILASLATIIAAIIAFFQFTGS